MIKFKRLLRCCVAFDDRFAAFGMSAHVLAIPQLQLPHAVRPLEEPAEVQSADDLLLFTCNSSGCGDACRQPIKHIDDDVNSANRELRRQRFRGRRC